MGSYDGVHSGHRELLRRVIALSKQKGVESVVLTFDPHPRYVLGSGEGLKLLNSLEEKIYLLGQMGVDNLIVVPFTEEFSQKSPAEFVENLIRTGIGTLVVGYNHRFGHKKEGDFDYLESQHTMLEIHRVEQQLISQSKVSSTIIRQIIAKGMMERAELMLSHPYIIKGSIAEDGKVGGIADEKLLPAEAEYEVEVDGRKARLSVGRDRDICLVGADIKGDVIIKFC